MLWLLARDGRLPARQWPLVHRRFVGQGGVWNLSDDFSVLEHAQLVVGRHLADFDGIESPLFEDAEDFVLATFLRDQQHALLRFAEHDLVGSHAGLALRHAVEFDLDADAAASTHFAGRAG